MVRRHLARDGKCCNHDHGQSQNHPHQPGHDIVLDRPLHCNGLYTQFHRARTPFADKQAAGEFTGPTQWRPDCVVRPRHCRGHRSVHRLPAGVRMISPYESCKKCSGYGEQTGFRPSQHIGPPLVGQSRKWKYCELLMPVVSADQRPPIRSHNDNGQVFWIGLMAKRKRTTG